MHMMFMGALPQGGAGARQGGEGADDALPTGAFAGTWDALEDTPEAATAMRLLSDLSTADAEAMGA